MYGRGGDGESFLLGEKAKGNVYSAGLRVPAGRLASESIDEPAAHRRGRKRSENGGASGALAKQHSTPVEGGRSFFDRLLLCTESRIDSIRNN